MPRGKARRTRAEDWTTPISNILVEDIRHQYVNELSAFHMEVFGSGRGLVQWFKDRLGRQTYCYTSWRRYWVWEDPDRKWRVFVNRQKGVGFEVPYGTLEADALSRWRDFIRTCGLEKIIGVTVDDIFAGRTTREE